MTEDLEAAEEFSALPIVNTVPDEAIDLRRNDGLAEFQPKRDVQRRGKRVCTIPLSKHSLMY